jgi:hypothetical protein
MFISLNVCCLLKINIFNFYADFVYGSVQGIPRLRNYSRIFQTGICRIAFYSYTLEIFQFLISMYKEYALFSLSL